MSAKVEALLFDLGGVIVELGWDRAISRWAADSGASVEELRRRYAFDAPYERHERGEIEAHEYFASLRRSLRILFFDDTLENVEGARAAGLQAVHVKTPQDVRQALRRVNVIPAIT